MMSSTSPILCGAGPENTPVTLGESVVNDSLTQKRNELQDIANKILFFLELRKNIIAANERDKKYIKTLQEHERLRLEVKTRLEMLMGFTEGILKIQLKEWGSELNKLYETQLKEFNSQRDMITRYISAAEKIPSSAKNNELKMAQTFLIQARNTLQSNISTLQNIFISQGSSTVTHTSTAPTSSPAKASSTLAFSLTSATPTPGQNPIIIIRKSELVHQVNALDQGILTTIIKLISKQMEEANLKFWDKQTTGTFFGGGRKFGDYRIATGMAEILSEMHACATYEEQKDLLITLSKKANARLQKFGFGRTSTQEDFYNALAYLYTQNAQGESILNESKLHEALERLTYIDRTIYGIAPHSVQATTHPVQAPTDVASNSDIIPKLG